MSLTAARISRRSRAVCQRCRDRKARFQTRGVVRADRDHTLCFECFRAERERQRARSAGGTPRRAAGLPFLRPAAPVRGNGREPGEGAPRGDEVPGRDPAPLVVVAAPAGDAGRRLVHRRRMLAHLERCLAAKGGP